MKTFFSLILTFSLLAFSTAVTDEGMYPLSYLSKLDLKKAGLEIDPSEIYNENGTSLVNALVRLGGCTGSFISDEGLIITNHHCVFSSVAALSTPENNYLKNGFYAETKDKELSTSLPCKITVAFEDVSDRVLEGVDRIGDAMEKQRKIAQNIKAIEEKESLNTPEYLVEISEMLVGKVYTLFRYKELKDVRIVYVPPQNIGKFGGETDNWEWPRHNADFSIVRAYENGEPYKPERYLEINAAGTKEGDFTFILGYPGRTYRNQPAQYLEYQQSYILPIISTWFDFRINAIEEYAGNDVSKQLAYSGLLASLNNTSKNFKGKLQGLQRTNIMEMAKERQSTLLEFAKQNPGYSEYVPMFSRLDSLYQRKFALVSDVIYAGQFIGNSMVANAAMNLLVYQSTFDTMDKKNVAQYLETNKAGIAKKFDSYFFLGDKMDLDRKLFSELVYQLAQSNQPLMRSAVEAFAGKNRDEVTLLVNELFASSELNDPENCRAVFEKNPIRFLRLKDPMIDFVSKISGALGVLRAEFGNVDANINEILPRLNDLEQARSGDLFIPDANGTLRFTYGYVKGYDPQDAVHFSPFTTINGIIQKNQGTTNPDYYMEEEIINKMQTIQPSDVLKHPKHDAVVVAFLYNMDTTGGNSGSPIMDSKGRLVGVNFDRAYTATINDYAWNESYSRSIGVDIRYVLYVMKYFGEADELLSELGVEL